jgi:hypothetical protein
MNLAEVLPPSITTVEVLCTVYITQLLAQNTSLYGIARRIGLLNIRDTVEIHPASIAA